jgi:hypothetical protein
MNMNRRQRSDMPRHAVMPADMPSAFHPNVCEFGDTPSDMPSDMPSNMPSLPAFVRLPGAFAPCFICGEGNVVSMPNTVFAFPGAIPPMTCGKKAEDGLAGLIDEEECQDLRIFAIFFCECTDA